MNPERTPEDSDKPGIWHRMWDMINGSEPEEENVEAVVVQNKEASRPRQAPMRIHSAGEGRVAVRRNVQVFEDAQMAADGLKRGEQQIVNLEHAVPPMGDRIVDFLSGVCYGVDGTVERIGDRVYMFVPANVDVTVEDGTSAQQNQPISPRD